MTPDELHSRLIDELPMESLLGLREILVEFQQAGGSQQDALDCLTRLRYEMPDHEDRILELVDFAAGWCRDDLRIW